MLKYVNSGIVFREIPDEVTLAINISGCPCRCPGCHSQYLWEDIGLPLTTDAIDDFVSRYADSITCLAFMGGDAEPRRINRLAHYIREEHPSLKVAWYSGRTQLSPEIERPAFDYIKLGPYLQHLGPLDKPTTNQHLYRNLHQEGGASGHSEVSGGSGHSEVSGETGKDRVGEGAPWEGWEDITPLFWKQPQNN